MATSRAEISKTRACRSPELIQAICSLLADGFSLRYACAELNFSQPFFYAWLLDDPEVFKQYTRAREIQAEGLADRIVELADEATPETANAQRLKVDARKWVAAKLLPKKYGDNQNQVNFNQTIVIPVLSAEKQQELQERRRRLLEG